MLPGDEKENFAELRALLTGVVEPQIGEFGGNIFKETAEIVLADFDDVVEAARCAAALRDAVAQTNQTLPEEQRIAMRIGINFGDIIAEEGDIFGDGVNIAARVEALAKPGSVYVSEIVHQQVADKVDFDFEDLGPQSLKNIARPIRVYRMAGEMAELSEDLVAAATLAASAPDFDDRRAIAVLPFANFSGDPEQEFFADGITEDIISMLAGWRAFPVIARNSTFTYKGKAVDIKKVGEELGVRYVLEGSVRKSGRRVRVTMQLIRADTNHHIMAERYDRDLTDLFELQDEIAHTIAGAIEPEILKFERERIAERPPAKRRRLRTLPAWRVAPLPAEQGGQHRGASLFPSCPGDRSAISAGDRRSLDRAIQRGDDLDGPTMPTPVSRTRTISRDSAVALDPRYPNAHFRLGLACMWTRRSERGMAAFEEAIKLNPSFAAAHVLLGQMYLYAGRPEETIALGGKGHPPQPQRSAPVHLASRARRRALPDAALCRGRRSRATVVVAQPELAARSALCRRRAGPARQDRRGAGDARRAQAGGREPGIFRKRLAARVPRSGRGSITFWTAFGRPGWRKRRAATTVRRDHGFAVDGRPG